MSADDMRAPPCHYCGLVPPIYRVSIEHRHVCDPKAVEFLRAAREAAKKEKP